VKLRCADLFAGAGGASTGLMLASESAGLDLDLVAVNHWPAAVKTHAANHPAARHMCEAIERVDPREAVPSGRLNLLVAGPECTFFSTARGGRPIDDQRRSSAWSILRWLELLRVDHVLIENVPEFQAWAPLNAHGRPMKSKRGEVYRAFLGAIEAMGYRVEARILNAADFGEATTRKRLFIQASRGRRPITWPEPSHSRRGDGNLLRMTRQWRAAREVIDWSLPSASIFGRKKPLSKNTLRRIEAGLARFGGRPFVLGQQSGSVPRSTDDPMPTIAADGAISCVEPFLVEYHTERKGEGPRVRDLNGPLPTQTTENRFGLVEPFLVPMYGERCGQEPRTHSVSEPVPTIPASGGGKFGLVEPFVVQVTHGGRARAIGDPLPTITGGQRGDLALIEPFLSSYYGNGSNVPVSQPVPTVTARDRFALVIPEGIDIRFRMLQPAELAAAMGFPPNYRFIGNKGDTIRMIGNAWSCRVAEALCSCILERWADRKPVEQEQESVA
jgi:DNA (cytosine-5)-methyltransferase 1